MFSTKQMTPKEKLIYLVWIRETMVVAVSKIMGQPVDVDISVHPSEENANEVLFAQAIDDNWFVDEVARRVSFPDILGTDNGDVTIFA